MHARQCTPGAADGVEVGPLTRRQPSDLRQFRLGDLPSAIGVVAGALGEADDAELQRLRLVAGAAIEPDDLERAAADIGQHPFGGGNAAQHPGGGEIGLLGAGEDADRHAGHAVMQQADEFRPVAGIAHRRGGQHLEGVGMHGARDGVVALHHLQRLGHALVIQPPGGLEPAAEP